MFIKTVDDSYINSAQVQSFFLDDRQVAKLTASKQHGKPHIFIELEEIAKLK